MTIWRRLRADFRDCPATMTLGTLWVVVFLLMVADQAAQPEGLSLGRLILGLHNGHVFGDLTLRELFGGEAWRALTATFVHYGLLHIGMNLFALYQLGGLVESWYGAGPFMAIYVLTGGGGNVLSGLIRQWLRSSPLAASGGGSTVIMGLVGLCAVVGWRSQTRIGEHLRNQMIWVILLTAGIGVGFSAAGLPVIDNWGHAGGTIVGALIGLANQTILHSAGGRLARLAGWLGAGTILASALVLVADDRNEAERGRQFAEVARQRLARDNALIDRLDQVRVMYRAIATPRAIKVGEFRRLTRLSQPPPPASPAPLNSAPSSANASVGVLRPAPENEFEGEVLTVLLRLFNSLRTDLDNRATSADFRQAQRLLVLTFIESATFDEIRAFDDYVASIQERLRQDREVARFQAMAFGTGRPPRGVELPR